MEGACEERSELPIQTVVGHVLLETQRADLGGVVWEEKEGTKLCWKEWTTNG